jgi:hypothetical protein
VIRRKSIIWRLKIFILLRQKSVILNRFFSLITPNEYRAQTNNRQEEDLKELFAFIQPKGTNLSLVRLGGFEDGSYVIPRDFLTSNHFLVSGGIENNNDFELKVADLGIEGIQIDNSIEAPPRLHANLSFTRKSIGQIDDDENVSLGHLLSIYPKGRRIILKLDIEGSELEALNALSIEEFEKIDCLIMELHNLSRIVEKEFTSHLFTIKNKMGTAGLTSIFCQANNGCLAYNIGGSLVPDNVELTFVPRQFTRVITSADFQRIKELTMRNIRDYAIINIDHILLGNHKK